MGGTKVMELSKEERNHWHEQAAYWGVRQEVCETGLEYATQQRVIALQKLGMLSVENTVELQQKEASEQ